MGFLFKFFYLFFSSFGYFICNVFTIFHFSPYLNVLTDFLTPLLLYICNNILQNEKATILAFFIGVVGFIIVIFGALILNEIIILNFFGLNENTYTNISERGKLDIICLDELGVPTEDNDNDDDISDTEGNVSGPSSANS